MTESRLAVHETSELHELLAFKNVCMTKSTTMQALVSDAKLNSLLQTCASTDRTHIQDLKELLSRAATTTIQ